MAQGTYAERYKAVRAARDQAIRDLNQEAVRACELVARDLLLAPELWKAPRYEETRKSHQLRARITMRVDSERLADFVNFDLDLDEVKLRDAHGVEMNTAIWIDADSPRLTLFLSPTADLLPSDPWTTNLDLGRIRRYALRREIRALREEEAEWREEVRHGLERARRARNRRLALIRELASSPKR